MTMIFRGVINLPLYIAPYSIPTNVIDDCGVPFIGPNGVEPTIATDIVGGYTFNAMVLQPFDYGQTLINPGQATRANSGIAFDGTWCPWSQTTVGEPDGVEEMIGSWGYLATKGGNVGDIQTQAFARSMNPLLTSGYDPATYDGQYINFISNSAFIPYPFNTMGCLYNTYNASSVQAYFPLSNIPTQRYQGVLNGDFLEIGLPSFANKDVIFYPPAGFGPAGYRYLPWSQTLPNNYLPYEIANVPIIDPPIEIEFQPEHSSYADCLTNLHNGDLLVGISSQEYFPNMPFTIVFLDFSKVNLLGEVNYYFVALNPKSAAAQSLIDNGSSTILTASVSREGVLYIVPRSGPQLGNVFHTKSLDLDYIPLTIETPQPFVLPCFNPCVPFIIPPKA